MKKLLLLLLLAAVGCQAASQTYLKTNMAYLAVGVPNITVEHTLTDFITLNIDALYSPWKSINGKPYLLGMLIPEARFYPVGQKNGFYTGLYVSMHQFKMSKWNYDSNQYQIGIGTSIGLNLGYKWRVRERMVLDFYFGGGWQLSAYRGYMREPNYMYAPWNKSGEWIPYKAGIAIGWQLGKTK